MLMLLQSYNFSTATTATKCSIINNSLLKLEFWKKFGNLIHTPNLSSKIQDETS